MNVSGTRGRRQTFQYGDETLSITEQLRKPEVIGYLEEDGPLTYPSQHEKLRRLLREERINSTTGHGTRNPKPTTATTGPRHALWNAATEGESSEKDRERRSVIWTGATAESTQETTQRYHHQRGKPHGPPGIGAVSAAT